MRLTLIGMSGVGKTHVSKKLEKHGYIRYTIDDFIEDKLHVELKKYGYKGLHDLSKWMGQPYDERYKKRSKRYLDMERKSLEDIIKLVKKSNDDNVVIDTTGSVIYLDPKLLEELSHLTKIIYFETSASQIEKMKQKYFEDPKPVIWGDIFHLRSDETSEAALRRCYPDLLKFRSTKYNHHSHLKISDHMLYNKDFTVQSFLDEITNITI